jgi:hypothetical protein
MAFSIVPSPLDSNFCSLPLSYFHLTTKADLLEMFREVVEIVNQRIRLVHIDYPSAFGHLQLTLSLPVTPEPPASSSQ